MSLGANPENTIKPSFIQHFPLSPVLIAVTHLAERAEEGGDLRIERIQRSSIASADNGAQTLLLSDGNRPAAATETPDQKFTRAHLNHRRRAAAHTANERMLSERFRSDVGFRVHVLSVRKRA